MTDNSLHNLSIQLEQVQTELAHAITWNFSDKIDQCNKESLILAINRVSTTSPDFYNLLVKQINNGTLVVSGINAPDNNTCGNDVFTINFTLDELFKVIMTFTEVRDRDSWVIDDENVEVIWLNPEEPKSLLTELLQQALLDEVGAMAESILKN